MLRKKYVVQKSFRIDQQLSEDLETLAEILERPQNDLVNAALEKLMQENLPWFKNNIIIDYFYSFLTGGGEEETFEMDGVNVRMSRPADLEGVKIEFSLSRDGQAIDSADYLYLGDYMDQTVRKLRELATLYLDSESPNVQAALKDRTNYR